MAASINDKFRKTAPIFSTTLASQKAQAAATMSLSSATGVPTDTALDFTVGRVDISGNRTPSAKAVYKGTVSGTTVSNLTLVEGTDQLHAAGTPVEITWTSETWTDAVDGILVEHDQDGTHGNITAGTIAASGVISAADHIDVVDGKAIRDGNDNELVKFAQTASAVNEVTVTNAATGNAPQLSATGGDTDISLRLKSKGTGTVQPGTPIAFRGTTVQTIASGVVDITTYTEVTDLGSNFNHTTGLFTVPFTGVYNFNGVLQQADQTGRMYISFIGSTTGTFLNNMFYNGVANGEITATGSITVALVAGETVKMQANNQAGASVALSNSFFCGHLVGRTD